MGDEVKDTAGVTPLVVVPGDQLDEVLVQGDTSLGIEDGGVGVAIHVGGDNVVLGVGQNACKRDIVSQSSYFRRLNLFGNLPLRGPSAAALMAFLMSS